MRTNRVTHTHTRVQYSMCTHTPTHSAPLRAHSVYNTCHACSSPAHLQILRVGGHTPNKEGRQAQGHSHVRFLTCPRLDTLCYQTCPPRGPLSLPGDGAKDFASSALRRPVDKERAVGLSQHTPCSEASSGERWAGPGGRDAQQAILNAGYGVFFSDFKLKTEVKDRKERKGRFFHPNTEDSPGGKLV